jgi:hypothetical protein
MTTPEAPSALPPQGGAASGPAEPDPRRLRGWRFAPILLGLLAAVAVAWAGVLDGVAESQVEAGLKRALVTFAVARSLNAAMSFAQEVQLHAQIGVGATIEPGQLLDPLNDLVEQFSTVMLAVCASYAGQRLLIGAGAHWLVSALLSAALLGWAWQRWRHGAAPRWLGRLAVALLLVRFAVPLAALGSEAAFQWAMAGEYAGTQGAFEAGTRQAEAALPAPPPADEGTADRLRRWWSQGADVGAALQQLQQKADSLVEHVVRLLALFAVQTMLLPLLLVWALQRAFTALLAPPVP